MLITMFTDISLCHATGMGAYAVWAKESGRTFRFAGLFRNPISDSNLAEAAAIVNGLYLVIEHFKPEPDSKIIAQSDSTAALSLMQSGWRSNNNRHMATVVGRRNGILAGKGIQVDYRHVKGHRGYQTPRNAVNTWCDRACREVLSKYRQSLS